MDELIQLASYIKERNQTELRIMELINRPAAIGHIGEYIASKIFRINLESSASNKGSDGYFDEGALKGRSVNIKWYALREGILDINAEASGRPDYYLVLAGPKSAQMTSKGVPRPWVVESVFLFDANTLVERLLSSGRKLGIAASVAQAFWEEAEIYPQQRSKLIELSDDQRRLLELFSEKTKNIFA